MIHKTPYEILSDNYIKACEEIKKDNGKHFLTALSNNQQEWLFTISNKVESLKAVVTALATSLTKKIENPKQDVRYHKDELKGGYSGRTYDTKHITPFFKEKFHRLSMKESGWLTRSIEQPHPFTLKFPGKIRDKKVKESFLRILNDIEEIDADPRAYLIALFILLIQKTTIAPVKPHIFSTEKATIDVIIRCLKSHFFQKYTVSGASRLPVIAIYSIYEILIKDVKRYQGKLLKPIRSHISSDVRSGGIGDIEIVDDNDKYFEGVEIKHNIPINATIIRDSHEKFRDIPIKRYYILTTAEPNVEVGEEDNVIAEIEKVKREHGCEVIVNGIIPSLRYYLRLLPEPRKFIKRYTVNLKKEFSKSTEVKKEHIISWEILLAELER